MVGRAGRRPACVRDVRSRHGPGERGRAPRRRPGGRRHAGARLRSPPRSARWSCCAGPRPPPGTSTASSPGCRPSSAMSRAPRSGPHASRRPSTRSSIGQRPRRGRPDDPRSLEGRRSRRAVRALPSRSSRRLDRGDRVEHDPADPTGRPAARRVRRASPPHRPGHPVRGGRRLRRPSPGRPSPGRRPRGPAVGAAHRQGRRRGVPRPVGGQRRRVRRRPRDPTRRRPGS